MRPKTGSVHMAEYWTKGNNDWKGPQVPTDVRSGQLRLVREGARARCQISEGLGKEFKTILEKADFSTEDIQHMVFQVTDGNKPGYDVDARLVELRVRHGRSDAKAGVPVPGKNVVPQAEQPADTSFWLVITFALCSALTLIVLGAFVVFLLVRRRRKVDAGSPPVEIVAFKCESCGKNLKTKAMSAGKSLKCPKCGTTVVVPKPI
jgi:DNA-directed RNA polymerase subunit RPC12/RpoP